jgi:DNA-3-methyladenine glycosylase
MSLKISQDFYEQPTVHVARQLLGKYLVRKHPRGVTIGKIVETEAYVGPDDKASHASRGRTARTEIMFGPAGFAYVYLIYGFYHCLNIVTERAGYPAAVLIRAVEPVGGMELMQSRRGTTDLRKLTSGPGRLCQAFAIDRSLNGADVSSSVLYVEDRGESLPQVASRPRIGVDYAGRWKNKRWRFLISRHPCVSKP